MSGSVVVVAERTLYYKQRCGDDARDDVARQTLVDALVVPRQLHYRQVPDVLQRPRRRRELAVHLQHTATITITPSIS